MLGVLRARGIAPETVFTGEGHAPLPLSDEEAATAATTEAKDLWNLPHWLIPEFERSLAEGAKSAALALQDRAPVTLRVNLAKISRAEAAAMLRAEGMTAVENPLAAGALSLSGGERRLRASSAYIGGYVELQDAASQAVIEALPEANKCLDYCAGGGGKALAMAAQPGRYVFAHDIDPNRMKDLEARAARAGVKIPQLTAARVAQEAPFDLVLCDVPCSGSGSWRRAPEAKWAFTPARLEALRAMQDSILEQSARLLDRPGVLVYATCSVLKVENEDRVEAFLARNPKWRCTFQRRFDITKNGDGFFTAHFTVEG
jgi:16S rRNA (cytosine967-C5)-methyltransferase